MTADSEDVRKRRKGEENPSEKETEAQQKPCKPQGQIMWLWYISTVVVMTFTSAVVGIYRWLYKGTAARCRCLRECYFKLPACTEIVSLMFLLPVHSIVYIWHMLTGRGSKKTGDKVMLSTTDGSPGGEEAAIQTQISMDVREMKVRMDRMEQILARVCEKMDDKVK
ncbi:hypothetical protein AAP_01276 [Ascosphaera apis ARSEF 7405]|uniref:Uncharacterized protein n=1 Tax=Ascosphaera apis ARSEF 7405 TaxID=392613 RepID=A0A166PB84_9EURO|nr:hypothetical protein AAP_01276 [Ascosphaera apis ARSEF 7405]